MDANTSPVTWRNHTRLGYERLARGVYGTPPYLDDLNEWEARRVRFLAHTQAVMSAYHDRDIALYGPTALQVLRVALPANLEDWTRCHVLVRRGSYQPQRQLVVAHTTTSDWKVWRTKDGLALLHPVDHWLQLRGTEDELVEVADGLLRRQHPLIGLDDFSRRLDQLAGTTGARTARRLMKLVVPGTDSLYETRTRLILVRAGLPCPIVNLQANSRSGAVYYIDMAYEREKIAIEYDGAGHVGSTAQMARDAQRRRDLQSDGWLIVSITAEQLEAPTGIVRSVEEALVLRRAALPRRGGN